jgi:hypothetical protein
MNFRYEVFGIPARLLWNSVNEQSSDVRTRVMVVAKWIVSLRYNGTIVVNIKENEGT